MPDSTSSQGTQLSSFETNQPVLLSIGLSQGTVQVIASDRADTVVAVNPSDRNRPADVEAARRTVMDLANLTLSITAPKKPRGIAGQVVGWGRSGSVDLTVEVPEGSSLRADAGAADFLCDGRLGDVEVRTGVGNVRLDHTGALRVHSGAGRFAVEETSGNAEVVAAGDMSIGTVAGDADITNRNGKTWIGHVGGNVRVKSANGDITIDDAGGDVNAKTANGSIRLGQLARGSATIKTAAGGLEIGIKEGTAAWIDANTRFGQIHNTLSPTDDPEQSTDTVQVRARTSFGDVLITRSQPGQVDR
jgi:hypothetical protein